MNKESGVIVMKNVQLILVLFALFSSVFFVFAAIGRSLRTELLAFPIIAIAISQLISLWHKR
jgi:hypothetical protein